MSMSNVNAHVDIHLETAGYVEISIEEIKREDCTSFKVLRLGEHNVFVSDAQIKQIHKITEKDQYDETTEQMESRLTSQIIALETELQEVKDKLYFATLTPEERQELLP